MTTIAANCILKSQSTIPGVKPVSTLVLRYPRIIHAEARTHRLLNIGGDEIEITTPGMMADKNLSRNASSSRAVPVSKLIDDVMNDPFEPLFWGANRPGMQANEELSGTFLEIAKLHYYDAMHEAVEHAKKLADLGRDEQGNIVGAHKQIINRMLEPYSHITVVVTANEWDNFFKLRIHPDAEPHIKLLAERIKEAIDNAPLQALEPGEWHLPFIERETIARLNSEVTDPNRDRVGFDDILKYSAACSASTSYKTVEGFDMTLERSLKIYDNLVKADVFHASPFEHQLQADRRVDFGDWAYPDEHRNTPGYRQHRAQIEKQLAA